MSLLWEILLEAPVAGLVQAAAGVASLPAELIDLATLEEGEKALHKQSLISLINLPLIPTLEQVKL